jgi:hypothetical protein
MHGKAARVAGAISGESRMKKISGNVRRNSRCRLFASFPSCRKQQKLKYWASRFCDLAHRSGRTTGKRIVLAVEPSSSRSAAIHCVNSRRRPTGSNCSSMERSFRQISFQLSGKNGANGMSDIHGKAVRVSEHGARGERRLDGQAAR